MLNINSPLLPYITSQSTSLYAECIINSIFCITLAVFGYPRVARYPKCGLFVARYPPPPSRILDSFRPGWTTTPLRTFCRYAHPARHEDSHHRRRKPPYARTGAERCSGRGVPSNPRRRKTRHRQSHHWDRESPSSPATCTRDLLASRNPHLLSRSCQRESRDWGQFDSPASLKAKMEWLFWKLADTHV